MASNVFSLIYNGIIGTYGEQWRTNNENDEQGSKIAYFWYGRHVVFNESFIAYVHFLDELDHDLWLLNM